MLSEGCVKLIQCIWDENRRKKNLSIWGFTEFKSYTNHDSWELQIYEFINSFKKFQKRNFQF